MVKSLNDIFWLTEEWANSPESDLLVNQSQLSANVEENTDPWFLQIKQYLDDKQLDRVRVATLAKELFNMEIPKTHRSPTTIRIIDCLTKLNWKSKSVVDPADGEQRIMYLCPELYNKLQNKKNKEKAATFKSLKDRKKELAAKTKL